MKLNTYIEELLIVLEKFGDLDVLEIQEDEDIFTPVEGVVGESTIVNGIYEDAFDVEYLSDDNIDVIVNAVIINDWFDDKEQRGF